MRFSRASLLAATASALAIGTTPVACNVFVDVDRCSSDLDCPGARCDLAARICVMNADGGPDVLADHAAEHAVDQDAPLDAPVDTGPPCDLDAPFGTPIPVSGLEGYSFSAARFGAAPLGNAQKLPDENTVFFSALDPACVDAGGNPELCSELYFAVRSSLDAGFGRATKIPGPNVNVPDVAEYMPTLSADGKKLYFESSRSRDKVAGSYVNDQSRIWLALRPGGDPQTEFDEPKQDTTFRDAPVVEGSPYLHPDGKSLYFMSYGRQGNQGSLDIYVALGIGPFGLPTSVENVGPHVNTSTAESLPVISADDQKLFFAREDVTTRRDIYVSHREGDGGFGEAGVVESIRLRNTADAAADQFPSWVSSDGCRIYFASNHPATTPGTGTYGLYVAARPK